MSAAAAIKSILNATKSVGSTASTSSTTNSSTNSSANNSSTGGSSNNVVASEQDQQPQLRSTVVGGISISLGIGQRNGNAAMTVARQNGDSLSSPLSQTLQQLTGSPGRARDRNLFHLPPNASSALALPLLRGCYWLCSSSFLLASYRS